MGCVKAKEALASVYYNRGFQLETAQQYGEAILNYRNAEKEGHSEADKSISRCEQLWNDFEYNLLQKGIQHEGSGQYQKAIACYKKVRTWMYPSIEDRIQFCKSNLLFEWGKNSELHNNLNNAKKCYERASNLGHVGAREALARYQQKL